VVLARDVVAVAVAVIVPGQWLLFLNARLIAVVVVVVAVAVLVLGQWLLFLIAWSSLV
jgi:hypothetical protein